MAYEGIHRIPITSLDGGEVIGILSPLDILKLVACYSGYSFCPSSDASHRAIYRSKTVTKT
ncbi:MAG: hypothetical protein R3C68_08365 [Myxococcota bacterium]